MKKQKEYQMNQRAQAVTEARKNNNYLEETIRAMELEMKLPGVRKRFAKFVVRQEFKRYFIKRTLPVFRWVRWVQFFFISPSMRRTMVRELSIRQETEHNESQK